MKAPLIRIIGIVAILVGILIYGISKMKNVPEVESSREIQHLTESNFSSHIKNDLVLVDFWADWCRPCHMMAPILNEIAEDEELDIVVAKVNVDEESMLANQYQIRNLPTLVIFKDGREVFRIVGVRSKEEIVTEIQMFKD